MPDPSRRGEALRWVLCAAPTLPPALRLPALLSLPRLPCPCLPPPAPGPPSGGPRPHPPLTSAAGWWPGALVTVVATDVHAPGVTHQARWDAPAVLTAEVGSTGSWGQRGRLDEDPGSTGRVALQGDGGASRGCVRSTQEGLKDRRARRSRRMSTLGDNEHAGVTANIEFLFCARRASKHLTSQLT